MSQRQLLPEKSQVRVVSLLGGLDLNLIFSTSILQMSLYQDMWNNSFWNFSVMSYDNKLWVCWVPTSCCFLQLVTVTLFIYFFLLILRTCIIFSYCCCLFPSQPDRFVLVLLSPIIIIASADSPCVSSILSSSHDRRVTHCLLSPFLDLLFCFNYLKICLLFCIYLNVSPPSLKRPLSE